MSDYEFVPGTRVGAILPLEENAERVARDLRRFHAVTIVLQDGAGDTQSWQLMVPYSVRYGDGRFFYVGAPGKKLYGFVIPVPLPSVRKRIAEIEGIAETSKEAMKHFMGLLASEINQWSPGIQEDSSDASEVAENPFQLKLPS